MRLLDLGFPAHANGQFPEWVWLVASAMGEALFDLRHERAPQLLAEDSSFSVELLQWAARDWHEALGLVLLRVGRFEQQVQDSVARLRGWQEP